MRGMRFLTAIGSVFLVMLAGLGGVPSLAVGGDPAIEPFTEMELIDDRIDLNAQRSLLRISKTGIFSLNPLPGVSLKLLLPRQAGLGSTARPC